MKVSLSGIRVPVWGEAGDREKMIMMRERETQAHMLRTNLSFMFDVTRRARWSSRRRRMKELQKGDGEERGKRRGDESGQ
jgi:hypothetical protein